MMENIKALAEGRRPRSRAMDAATVDLWALTVALLGWAIAAAIRRGGWGRPVACLAAAALIFQVDTLLAAAAPDRGRGAGCLGNGPGARLLDSRRQVAV